MAVSHQLAREKTEWRQFARSGRRRRSALASVVPYVPDAVVPPALHPTCAPSLDSVLPTAGEWAAVYLSVGDEPPTAELLRLMAAREIRLLAPAPGPSFQSLNWAEVEGATCALPTAPVGELPDPTGPRLEPSALGRCQLILCPALLVDRSGTRLGRGGGWYDRALAHAAPGALVLAVCYPEELLPADTLPRQDHDRPVHGALLQAGAADSSATDYSVILWGP